MKAKVIKTGEVVKSEIDWEQRRYEIAKEMLPQLYKRSFEVGISGISSEQVQGMLCAGAIEFADELIKQLKGD
jgi:hypothetical protein